MEASVLFCEQKCEFFFLKKNTGVYCSYQSFLCIMGGLVYRT